MLNFSETQMESLAIHQIGNKANGEEMTLSESTVNINDEVTYDILQRYFLHSFKGDVFYQFNMEETENPVKELVDKMLENETSMLDFSKGVAKLLFECGNHPRIKSGELYTVMFRNCIIEDEICDAVGIFKSEQKDTFLKINFNREACELSHHEGINIKKLDKGCLVFNSEKEHGYRVCVVDHTNGNDEARYWKDQFLNLRHRDQNFYQTQSYISLVKNFVKDVVEDELQQDKKEQTVLLNRSAEFFAEKQSFKADDFEKEVLKEAPEVVESFRRYKNDFEEENNFKIKDDFEISTQAVKTNKKQLRSVIKLDKNFHVYVHGKEDYLEKGFDDGKGMNFYKLFFHAES